MRLNAQLVNGKMIDDKDLCIFKTSIVDFLKDISVDKMIKLLEGSDNGHAKDIFLQSKISDEVIKKDLDVINKFVERICKEQYAQIVDSEFIRTTWVREPELIKWGKGTNLPQHFDGTGKDNKPNITLGALIYLNDDYDGGEIYFPEHDILIKPKYGDLVIFPCHFLHEVKQVLLNDRYTIPLFYTFTCKEWM